MFVAPRYYDWRTVYPQLQSLLDNFDTIRDELLAVVNWTAWPERSLYNPNGEWSVVPFLHTFPALSWSSAKFIGRNCSMCPRTMAILGRLTGLRTVILSRLGPKTVLSPHQGYADLANHVLRCHLPLTLPRQRDSCGVTVENEVRYHVDRDFVVFDDSKTHSAFNNTDNEERVVLLLDLLRPPGVPKGVSDVRHTEELDQFIDEYNNTQSRETSCRSLST